MMQDKGSKLASRMFGSCHRFEEKIMVLKVAEISLIWKTGTERDVKSLAHVRASFFDSHVLFCTRIELCRLLIEVGSVFLEYSDRFNG